MRQFLRLAALCPLVATAACAPAGQAELTAGQGATTTSTTAPASPSTTLLPLPTTAPSPTVPPPTTAAPPTTGAPTSTAVPTTRPSLLTGAVRYSVTGGIAGVRDTLVVEADGRARFQGRMRDVDYIVEPDNLLRLAEVLERARFSSLQSVYGFAVPDGFEYRVSYVGRTVLAFDSAGPSRLRAALAVLAEEMDRARVM